MPGFRLVSWAAAGSLALLFAQAAIAADKLPLDAQIPKDYKIPADLSMAVYLPSNDRKERFFMRSAGFWAEPGKALEDSLNATMKHLFTKGFLASADDQQPYGLLVVIHPEWKGASGTLTLTMDYQVYGEKGAKVLEGKQSFAAGVKAMSPTKTFATAALGASQLVMGEIVAKLRPDATKYAASSKVADFDPKLLVNHEHPVATGTGFFINAAGQVMTAAHVLHDCALTEVKREDQTYNSKVVALSVLLDLAVIDTGVPVTKFLPLRKDAELFIGEPVANVGFPLQPILSANPSLTRGNVSSRGALTGSLGQFQFSAPIQPGSSGGPVVSDGGELLGVTVSTLNAAPLLEQGALPQNVNFALDAKYAAMFLHKNNIVFTEVPANLKGDIRIGNDAALATVVRLSCYQ